ncbi:MAG: response regulator transcription factor [Deltaproteobacteria bacterium]|nr:response regulator transcription factor [Deltaproteobacteria bacterium]
MNRILLIDDDIELGELLTEYMASEGFTVESVPDGEEGVKQALSGSYTLVILDVMLPGISGFEVLRRLRAATTLPVLMLTARGDDVDRIVGLEMGADDYLPKPFNSRELVARIRAVLRRASKEPGEFPTRTGPQKLKIGDIEMDFGTLEVSCQGEPVDMTAVEFKLLEVLVRKAGTIISREELTAAVLGRPLSPYDRSIDVHVSKIRKKLGHEIGGIERIKSVRNAGYLYVLHSSRENGQSL